MFRQDEVFLGGWHEKTLEFMQKKRFERMVAQLPQLGAARLESLSAAALQRRIEQSWQNIERKPMRTQQLGQIRSRVLGGVREEAACLSKEEHDLVERALILGGSAPIREQCELDAARALSLRLWASVGLVAGSPYAEIDMPVARAAAAAFAQEEHECIRRRLYAMNERLRGMLYRVGAMDDRLPQQMVLREAMMGFSSGEHALHLARCYLWSEYDCVDYSGGVMLLHPALADPAALIADGRRKTSLQLREDMGRGLGEDILPEEIPLQRELERLIEGLLRDGCSAWETVRSIRYICKQGAPLSAMENVLQASLIVLVTTAMRTVLREMYCSMPKWIECVDAAFLQ